MELLKQPFSVPPAPETIALRAQATETVGIMGVAMGKEAFAPYFPTFMHHIVVENFALGSAALREQSFGFKQRVRALRTIEEDKAVLTNRHLLAKAAMPIALEDDMKQLEAAQKSRESGGGGGAVAAGDDGSDDDDDDDDDDEAEEIHMRVRTADVEEKCSAINAIGVFAETLLTQFGPERVARCMEPLSVLDGHYYPNIRSNMMIASARLVKAAHGRPEVEKSLQQDTLTEAARNLLDDLIHQILLKTMNDDTDKEVVAAACEAMQILLDFFGPQCFRFGPDAIVKECISFLRQKSGCQMAVDFDPDDSDQDDVDGEDVLFREADQLIAANPQASWRDVVKPEMVLQGVKLSEDHDDVIMDYASDMLDSLAKAYGPAFAEYAPYLMPLLVKYCDPTERDASDITMGIGSYAVLLQALGPAWAAQYFDTAIGLSFAILEKSEESTARGNSCYLLRILIEACPDRFTANVSTIQQTLQALWSVAAGGESLSGDGSSGTATATEVETPGAVDNAISATCSLVRCCSLLSGGAQPSPLLAMWPTILPAAPRGADAAGERRKRKCHRHFDVFAHSSSRCHD
ncbi:uncharacterized protein LOC126766741, partial [Bactrocera neohumeralis]|uniref:uncharacterized protein LOC126766741 n=1 Tax=Bactrocera neohumeralis TaxID=98809 RepID=UPI002165E1A9